MKKILGIDESGRGPVIGPLVICGYLIDQKNLNKLKKTGVCDSKLLSHRQRTKLDPKLRKLSDKIILKTITPQQIDKLRTITNLNKIEIAAMQEIIEQLHPDKVIVDSIEANTAKFTAKLRANLNQKPEIIAENFADRNHLEVAAASVIAKLRRDYEVSKLIKHGFTGTGYPSDSTTISFLKKWLQKNGKFPEFVRKSWATAKLMLIEKEQKSVTSFATFSRSEKARTVKACGAIIFHKNEFLLIKHKPEDGGHWGFPKGRVEEGETEQETALREIFEETGLKPKLIPSFRHEIHYPVEDAMKNVIFFLAEAKTKKVRYILNEIEDHKWLPYAKARKQLTFDNNKELLKKANKFIKKHC
jgi:ribonuclease HII